MKKILIYLLKQFCEYLIESYYEFVTRFLIYEHLYYFLF